MARRSWSALVGALWLTLGIVGLTGCTVQADQPEASPDWVEPGWMTQVRQANDEYQSAMLACYAEHGLEGVRSMGGGVGFVNLPQDAATQQLVDETAQDCNARVPHPEYRLDKTLDDAAYQRMLEARECIIAHGYEVPEPPSAETWKDSALAFAWNPYRELASGVSTISADDVYAVEQACPQPGPNFYVLAPTGS